MSIFCYLGYRESSGNSDRQSWMRRGYLKFYDYISKPPKQFFHKEGMNKLNLCIYNQAVKIVGKNYGFSRRHTRPTYSFACFTAMGALRGVRWWKVIQMKNEGTLTGDSFSKFPVARYTMILILEVQWNPISDTPSCNHGLREKMRTNNRQAVQFASCAKWNCIEESLERLWVNPPGS